MRLLVLLHNRKSAAAGAVAKPVATAVAANSTRAAVERRSRSGNKSTRWGRGRMGDFGVALKVMGDLRLWHGNHSHWYKSGRAPGGRRAARRTPWNRCRQER